MNFHVLMTPENHESNSLYVVTSYRKPPSMNHTSRVSPIIVLLPKNIVAGVPSTMMSLLQPERL